MTFSLPHPPQYLPLQGISIKYSQSIFKEEYTMPAIKKDDKQLIALQEVSDGLALVKLINAAMDTPVPSNMQLTMTPEEGKPIKLDIPIDEIKQVNTILAHIRTKAVKEIRAKAGKFKIELDEKEQQIIEDR